MRLVKGAYKEPKAVAYPKKADVDAAYARMLKTLLTDGHDPAIATHDPAMIELARTIAREHDIAPDRFEFQMLYGVRRDLQTMLVKAGYRVRVYIPFGREWFPYFMRRLGERPANVHVRHSRHPRRPWVARFHEIAQTASFDLRPLRRLLPHPTPSASTASAVLFSQPLHGSALTAIRTVRGTALDIN